MRYFRYAIVVVCLAMAGCTTTGNKTSASGMVAIASKYEGLHERKHNKQLRKMLNVNPASVRWCGYFMGYVAKKAGKTPPKGYPKARSWLTYGTKVPKRKARMNDIVVTGNHVGVVISANKSGVYTISGNSSNQVRKSFYTWNKISGVRR